MAGLSLNDAWNEAVAFARGNMQMVAIWAAVGVVVPTVAQLLIVGGTAEQQAMLTQMMSGSDPTAMMAALGGGLALLTIFSQLVTTASYFGAWRMGLAQTDVPAAQAGAYALGAAVTSLILLALIFFFALLVLFIPLGLIGGLGAMRGGNVGAGGMLAAVGVAVIAMLLIFPLMLWLAARLSVMGPAMASAGSINPLYGVTQSWQLTKASQWTILGYFVLLVIALIVVSMVIGIVVAAGMMIGGAFGPGEAGVGTTLFATLVGAALGIPLAMAYIAIPAGLFRALSPDNKVDIFA